MSLLEIAAAVLLVAGSALVLVVLRLGEALAAPSRPASPRPSAEPEAPPYRRAA